MVCDTLNKCLLTFCMLLFGCKDVWGRKMKDIFRKMSNKKKLAILCNFLIIIFEMIATVMSIQNSGLYMFAFYTQDSNFFALFASIAYLVYVFVNANEEKMMPRWITDVKYMSVCCVMLTFIVVITILSPMTEGGYRLMLFGGSMLYMHLLCPLIAFVSFVFLEEDHQILGHTMHIAFIPTAVYAVLIIILNILRVIVGPYPFLRVYQQPVYMSILWSLIILGAAYLFSYILYQMLRKKTGEVHERKRITK